MVAEDDPGGNDGVWTAVELEDYELLVAHYRLSI